MVGSLIKAHLLGSMEEDEYDYDHTRIDDSTSQVGGNKKL